MVLPGSRAGSIVDSRSSTLGELLLGVDSIQITGQIGYVMLRLTVESEAHEVARAIE